MWGAAVCESVRSMGPGFSGQVEEMLSLRGVLGMERASLEAGVDMTPGSWPVDIEVKLPPMRQ